MSALLQVENLCVSIAAGADELHAVRHVDLTVAKGETLCIVGESGCGKSMTALALMGLLPAHAKRTADRIEFAERSLLDIDEYAMSDMRGNRIAMIFQDPMTSLNPCYTIGNQLEEAMLRHRRTSRSQARERAVYLLDRVGIPAPDARLRQYPHQLSGGLRQRVMIAMALMCEPDLLIADEPTTALDVTIQAQILLLIARLQRELGIGVVLITHDLGVVARVADRVCVMYAGEVVETGPPAAIFREPRHPYTCGLLDCLPVPDRDQANATLGVIPGTVPSLTGDLQGCAFRNRCRFARSSCATTVPWRVPAKGRGYRCLLEERPVLNRADRAGAPDLRARP